MAVRYDIFFVRRDPGQSFADALEETEESYHGDPGPLSAAEREQWDRLVARARDTLGPVEEFATDTSRELSHPGTGIEISMIAGEMTITLVDAGPGQDSIDLMTKVYALARIVEDETGLEGYDPQLEEPVSTPTEALPPGQHPSAGSDEEDIRARTVAAAAVLEAPKEPGSALTPDRRWWEFWKP
ncbi:MAG: hypothetical protein QOH80_2052 [Actinomycetota bacterium]|nr:hypothetical protein [Actinomycetota bacterium]